MDVAQSRGTLWGVSSLTEDPNIPMIDPGSRILHVQKCGTIRDHFVRASGAMMLRRRPIGGGN